MGRCICGHGPAVHYQGIFNCLEGPCSCGRFKAPAAELGPDLLEAERLKAGGIEQVTEGSADWHEAGLLALAELRKRERAAGLRGWGREATGEELKARLVPLIGEPHHVNAWGALINSAARAGLLLDTGRTVKCRLPVSHARRTVVWRWNI
jgi:hypothetical protein